MVASRPSESVESIEPSPLLDNLPEEILEIVLNSAVDSFETIQERQKERMKQRVMTRSWFEIRKVVKEFWIGDLKTAKGVLAELERDRMSDAVKVLDIKLEGEEMDEVVAEIIRKCSNIERLRVLFQGVLNESDFEFDTPLHRDTITSIAQISNLKHLHLESKCIEFFVLDGYILDRMIKNCTKLEHLRLPPMFSPLPPASASLTSLSIILQYSSDLKSIDPLIRGSTTLRKLEINVRGLGGPVDRVGEDFYDLMSTLPNLDHFIYTDSPTEVRFLKTMSKITLVTRLELTVGDLASNTTFLAPLSNLKHLTINALSREGIIEYTKYFEESGSSLETFTIKAARGGDTRTEEEEAGIQELIEALGSTKFIEIIEVVS